MQCEQNKCERDATTVVFWPGNTTKQCDGCAAQVVILGELMGYEVDTLPLASQPETKEASDA